MEPRKKAESLRQLDDLVLELGKKYPDEKIIEKGMGRLGLSYCSDPVEQISRILSALHPVKEEKNLS